MSSNESKQGKQSGGKGGGKGKPEQAPDLYEARLAKLNQLKEQGANPYNLSFQQKHVTEELLAVPEEEYDETVIYTLAGRIRGKRVMGKMAFMNLEDAAGKIQIVGARDELSTEEFTLFKSLDLGDIVGVEGFLFKTKTGEISVRLRKVVLLAKCLRTLPVVKEADGKVFDAFADKEQRYRMRYVDLIVNPDVKKTFTMRSRIISLVRSFLTERSYLEVETPMMQPIPGGAAARPFITHHNALDMQLYLRIAPELYLKRLIVGGFAKVFELNRNFRNEGISFKHNPEFTMLELYEAYGDMNSMLELCQELISDIAQFVHQGTEIPYGKETISLAPPFARLTYVEALEKYAGAKFTDTMTIEEGRAEAKRVGVPDAVLDKAATLWKIADAVFEEKVESKLIQPTFLTHYPTELSPLAKTWPENENFVERFELFVAGREIANAFSELNDPIDQKERFEEQVKQREAGDEEGGFMDLDYVRALEYGMPPAGGMGIGIDRLVMLLTDSHSIRDTILFPQLRAEKTQSETADS